MTKRDIIFQYASTIAHLNMQLFLFLVVFSTELWFVSCFQPLLLL